MSGHHPMNNTGQKDERQRLLNRDQEAFNRGGGVKLVDHPLYEAPKLTSTWGKMLPRMCMGCLCLVGILGAMGSVVWSVVSAAPGDPLHQHRGTATPLSGTKIGGGGAVTANSTAVAGNAKDKASSNGTSMFSWIRGILNSRPPGNS